MTATVYGRYTLRISKVFHLNSKKYVKKWGASFYGYTPIILYQSAIIASRIRETQI